MFAKNIIVGIAAVDADIAGAEIATLLFEQQTVGADAKIIQRRANRCAALRNQLTLPRRKTRLVRKFLVVENIFANHIKLRHLDVGIVRQLAYFAAFDVETVFYRLVKTAVTLYINVPGEKPIDS